MLEKDFQKLLANSSQFQELVSRWSEWENLLMTANEHLEAVLHSDLGRFLLEGEAPAVSSPVEKTNGRDLYPYFYVTQDVDPLNQQDLVERYAWAHDGIVDLTKTCGPIRFYDLTQTPTDKELMINLRTRLMNSGDWEKVDTYKLRLKAYNSDEAPIAASVLDGTASTESVNESVADGHSEAGQLLSGPDVLEARFEAADSEVTACPSR